MRKKSRKLGTLFKAMQERPIAYQRSYTTLLGSVTAGLLLSQLMYWASAMRYQEFYKTDKELMDETGLSLAELRSAKKKVRNYVHIRRKRVPAITHYKIEVAEIIEAIVAKYEEIGTSVVVNDDVQFAEDSTTFYTENTTETKTDTQKDKVLLPDVSREQVDEVIIAFKNVNPHYEQLLKRTTERKAAIRLVGMHGYRETLNAIYAIQTTNTKPYAPVITKPTEMENKIAKLMAFLQREKAPKRQGKRLVI